MYKDKDRQRQAVKEAVRRHRARRRQGQSITGGITLPELDADGNEMMAIRYREGY